MSDMTKKCPYHKGYDIKIFCSQENCTAYRLLCVKCTISANLKEHHRNHPFTLVEDLIKEFEKFKAENPELVNSSEGQSQEQPKTDSDCVPENTEEIQKPSSVNEEVNKALEKYRLFEKLMSETVSFDETMLRETSLSTVESNTAIPTTDTTEMVPTLPQIEIQTAKEADITTTQQRVGLRSIDPNRVQRTSICAFLKEKLLPLARQPNKLDFEEEEKQNENTLSTYLLNTATKKLNWNLMPEDRLMKESETNSIALSATPVSTKASSISVTSASGKKKFVPFTIIRDSKRSEAKSTKPLRSHTKKIVLDTSQVATVVSGVESAKVINFEDDTSLTENNLPLSCEQMEVVYPDRMIDENSAESSASKDDHKSGRGKRGKKNTFSAAEEYEDEEFQPEEEEGEEECTAEKGKRPKCDLMEELKKQITGFKEYSFHIQRAGSKKAKPKELKEMWKNLSKEEQDRWNSIASRKRIQLRDQLEIKKGASHERIIAPKNFIRRTKTG